MKARLRCLAIPTLLAIALPACGGNPATLTFWPPIGRSVDAVNYIEERTCDFATFADVPAPDVTVKFESRECGCSCAGASEGRISITPPSCGIYGESLGLGLAVHETIHVLGHWWHDAEPPSVMHPTVYRDWEIVDEDINWIIEEYCIGL